MSDDSQRALTRTDGDSSLTVSKLRSRLIVRGSKDAEEIARRAAEPVDPLTELRQRAEEGDKCAQWKLGLAYADGKGVPKDWAEAMKWWHTAADSGLGWAAEVLGDVYYEDGNYAEALRWCRKCTPSEFGYAELVLGKCYFYGNGVPQDYTEATRWLLEALETDAIEFDQIGYLLSRIYYLDEAMRQWRCPAEGENGWPNYIEDVKTQREFAEDENVCAQFCLGLAYTYGRGVTQDYAEAATWFRKAAEQGEKVAQFHLAAAHDKGRGVPQDYMQAHMWWNLAASNATGEEQEYASDARDELARKMTSEQIAEAQRMAREWKPRR